jgi:YbbR domain-containing protein
MFQKMMKHLANNPGLKLLSLLFAVIIWLVVVNVADPDATKTFSVPVEIINKDIITEMGKVPSVVGDTDIAVFTISGPRSSVDNMTSDDFSATADLSQVDLSQEGEAKLVPIEITAKKNERRIEIMRRTVNLQITLEDRLEKKFVISAESTGTPAEGYAIGGVEVTPNLLKVSGPASVVSKISRVGASINVDGISSDVSDNVIPVLYDEDGSVISSDLLEMNQTAVMIKAEIWATKSVPVQCRVSGEPAAGYEFRKVECAPETVLVKGRAVVLNGINVINIPADVIDITGAREDIESTVDIVPYLEELGISLVEPNASQIAVTVTIEEKETKKVDFPTSSIKVSGLNNEYDLTFNVESISMTVRALEEDMEALAMDQIEVLLDVADLQPGTYTRLLNVTLPGDKYELIGQVNVQFTIVDRNAETESAPINPDDSQEENNEGEDSGTSDEPEEDSGDSE